MDNKDRFTKFYLLHNIRSELKNWSLLGNESSFDISHTILEQRGSKKFVESIFSRIFLDYPVHQILILIKNGRKCSSKGKENSIVSKQYFDIKHGTISIANHTFWNFTIVLIWTFMFAKTKSLYSYWVQMYLNLNLSRY